MAVRPEIKFFFAIAPPREHFRAKRMCLWSFAMVDLGGVDKVSERLEQLFFNMELTDPIRLQWGTKGGAVP